MNRLLALLVFLLILCIPVFAQDATAEPVATVEAGQVTVVDGQGDTNITVEAPVTPVETPATNVLSISNIIAFLIGGVVTFAGAVAWLGSQARATMHDPAKMILAEKLGDSVPKESADKLIEGFLSIVEFLKEATDRQPAILKPAPAAPSVSSTGANFTTTTTPTTLTDVHGETSDPTFRG